MTAKNIEAIGKRSCQKISFHLTEAWTNQVENDLTLTFKSWKTVRQNTVTMATSNLGNNDMSHHVFPKDI